MVAFKLQIWLQQIQPQSTLQDTYVSFVVTLKIQLGPNSAEINPIQSNTFK